MHVLQDLNHALFQLIPQYESATHAPMSPGYNTAKLPDNQPHMVQPLLLINIHPHFLKSHFSTTRESVVPSCFRWFKLQCSNA